MKRDAMVLTVLVSAVFLGQARGQDQVFHRDKSGKSTQTSGTIQTENANKVTLKNSLNKLVDVPAGDIIDINYELRGEVKYDYNRGATAEKNAEKAVTAAERKKLFEDAIKNYEAVLPKAASMPFVARQLHYKLAMIRARLAGENKAMANAAITDLQKFRKDHANSWQSLNVLKMLAQLFTDQGQFEQAVQIFDDILKVPGLDQTTRTELELNAANYLLQAKKHADAEKRLTAILKALPPNDPKVAELRMMIIICQAHTNFGQAVKGLETMIAETKGPRLALAYNTLGDCYQLNNQPKEALYNYLFVDMIYNEDPAQHVRAVENIAKLFRQMNKADRAKEYENKLAELKK